MTLDDEIKQFRSKIIQHKDELHKDSSEFYFRKYRRHFKENQYTPTNVARYYYDLAYYYDNIDLDSSIYYRLKCIHSIPDSQASSFDFGVKIAAKAGLGLNYMQRSQNVEAVEHLEQAIEMSLKYNYPTHRLYAYSLLCQLYFDQNAYEKVIELSKESKGSILKYWGNYPEVMARIDRMAGRAVVENAKSTLEEKERMLAILLEHIEKESLKDVLNDVLRADVIAYFGELLSTREKLKVIHQMGEKYNNNITTPEVQYILLMYASVLCEDGNHNKAKDITLGLIKNDKFNPNIRESLVVAKILKDVGEHNLAFQYMERHLELTKEVHTNLVQEHFIDTQGKYELNRVRNHSDALEERNNFIFLLLKIAGILSFLVIALLSLTIILYRRLQKKHKKLVEIDKNKNELFLILAHDLKGPISSFDRMSKRVSYLIQKKDFQNLNKLALYFENIGNSIKYSVYNLLDWSLSQREKFKIEKERFDAKVKLQMIISELNYLSKEKEVNVILEASQASSYFVFMDTNSFIIAFRNIIHNAIKQSLEKSKVLIYMKVHDKQCTIDVQNIGNHMDENVLQKLNDLIYSKNIEFSSLKMRDSGIGLNTTIKLLKFNHCALLIRNLENSTFSFQVTIPSGQE